MSAADMELLISKLPRTADGHPIVPGMDLYQLFKRVDGSTFWVGEGDSIKVVMAADTGDYYDPHEQDWSKFYASKEEAAKYPQTR